MRLICLHVTPWPSQETFLEKENVQCHFITHTSWARYLRGRLEDLVFLSEIRFTNLGWERNVVEYKNVFYSKFLVSYWYLALLQSFYWLACFYDWCQPKQGHFHSPQLWLRTMLCTETIQRNEILFWSRQIWSGIIVTYDRTQYAIDIRTNDYIIWGTDKWQKQRTKGKTSRQRVELYKYEKTSAATLPQNVWNSQNHYDSVQLEAPRLCLFFHNSATIQLSEGSPPQPPLYVCGVVW